MSEKETGGSAFPMLENIGYNSDWQINCGMTLRDWFAGMALQNNSIPKYLTPDQLGIHTNVLIAEYVYGIADAMLEARKK